MKRTGRYWLLSLLLSALSLAAQAQQPILESPLFQLELHPDCKVLTSFDNGWQTRMVVEYEGQQIRINWGQDQALILFPTSTLRVKSEETKDGFILRTTSDGTRYEIKKSAREIGWLLPDHEVFYRTRGGKVLQAVGTNDFLKVRRDTRAGRVYLESKAGLTDALINSQGELEIFDGPEVASHIYFVKGFAFRQGPVTVKMPLPEGPFLNALPSDRFLTIEKTLEPLPEPTAKEEVVEAKDPLQAAPRTWSSPELRAKKTDPSEDPLSVKKERRVKHPVDPLKAKTQENSEEVLRAKGY